LKKAKLLRVRPKLYYPHILWITLWIDSQWSTIKRVISGLSSNWLISIQHHSYLLLSIS